MARELRGRYSGAKKIPAPMVQGLYCGRLFHVKKIESSVGSNDSREASDILQLYLQLPRGR
jgi:hypothetical protein